MVQNTYDLVIIGGGAAGVFCAINCAEAHPDKQIIILEKTGRLLSKVRISGGGRCNVTHACFIPHELVKNYPRGGKKLRSLFNQFGCQDTVNWFQHRGVPLKTESDGRMFPKTNTSQTIVDCLEKLLQKNQVQVAFHTPVTNLAQDAKGYFQVSAKNMQLRASRVFIATGGSPSMKGFDWLNGLKHTIENPVPSLFTFNLHKAGLEHLAGVSVPRALVRITGSKLEQTGPLLITHWGLSGPVILRLSAWGAREIAEKNYDFEIQVRWLADFQEEYLRQQFADYARSHPARIVVKNQMFELPQRLWGFICASAGIESEITWSQMSSKKFNRLVEHVFRMPFSVRGKTTFKDEFVTCGGISLQEVNLTTMESQKFKGLYFGGEILDIDAVTGGFNFQAAWASGFVAAKNLFAQK